LNLGDRADLTLFDVEDAASGMVAIRETIVSGASVFRAIA
jgi:hypothetical protein